MNYSEDFKELIKKSEALIEKSKAYSFIGVGNPNGKILYIGKECAIVKEKMKYLYKAEIEEHISRWCKNIADDVSQDNVDGQCEELIKQLNYSKYNPLFPYKGKMKTIFDETKRVEGVTRTWFFYQKLYDMICNKATFTEDKIDFLEDCFMSELSHIPAKKSEDVDEKSRKASIENRKELFKEPFYQSFPIVIIAAGPYPDKYKFDMKEIFSVDKLEGNTIKIGDKSICVYKGIHSPKLLIHTSQFSYTSNEQVAKIAELCREFIDNNNIKLKNQLD